MEPELFVIVLAVVLGAAVTALFVARRLVVAVGEGQALVVSRSRGAKVAFAPTLVLPVVERGEVMSLSLVRLVIERRARDSLICRDSIRADLVATFFVRVNKTAEDVLKVATAVGTARASEPSVLRELFEAKLSEALEIVAKQLEFAELYERRADFRDQVLCEIGQSLQGYCLDDLAIDFLEQTALEQLDPSNVFDAAGIRKIETITAEQRIRVHAIAQEEKKQVAKQDLEAEEVMAVLERQRVEMLARQKREIESIQARELGETLRCLIEEQAKIEASMLRARIELAEVAALRDPSVAAVAEELRVQAVANLESHSVLDRYLTKLHDLRAGTEASLAALGAGEEAERAARSVPPAGAGEPKEPTG